MRVTAVARTGCPHPAPESDSGGGGPRRCVCGMLEIEAPSLVRARHHSHQEKPHDSVADCKAAVEHWCCVRARSCLYVPAKQILIRN